MLITGKLSYNTAWCNLDDQWRVFIIETQTDGTWEVVDSSDPLFSREEADYVGRQMMKRKFH